MAINKFLWEQTDTLDATVFTGDCLFEKNNRDHLKKMCERWLNNIAIFEETEIERLIKIIEGMPAEYIPEGFWKLKGE